MPRNPRASEGNSTPALGDTSRKSSNKRKAEEEPDERPAKRHDVSTGVLSMMAEMPIDILHEIFKYLEPYDLLRLARTTRALRAILMRPDARGIWQSSFAGVDGPFPPCPDDLNEPQYANLIFSNHCHECGVEPTGKTSTLFMFMEARTQLCIKCSQKKFLKWQDLPDEIPAFLQEVIPATTKVFKKSRGRRSKPVDKFYVDTALEVFRQYKGLGRSEAKRNVWFEQQKDRYNKVFEHATLCEAYVTWAEEEARNKRRREKGYLSKVEMKRFDDFYGRLPEWREDMDYSEVSQNLGPEDLLAPCFYKHELVNRPVELTDSEFEVIKPILTTWLETHVRPKRLVLESLLDMECRVKGWPRVAYTNWVMLLPAALPIPSLAEACLLEAFYKPLENDEIPDSDLLERALMELTDFAEEWWQAKEGELLALVQKSSVYSAPGAEPIERDALLLASTAFLCRQCAQTYTYPSILTHGCRKSGDDSIEGFYAMKRSLDFIDHDPTTSSQAHPLDHQSSSTQHPPGYLPWRSVCWLGVLTVDSEHFQFSETAYYHTRALLDLCGMPYTTTLDELKAANPYFQGKCSQFKSAYEEQDTRCMPWWQVHTALPHNQKSNYSTCLALVPQEEVAAYLEAYPQKASKPALPLGIDGERRDCFLCGTTTGIECGLTQSQYLQHIQHRHKADPTRAQRYVEMLFDRTTSGNSVADVIDRERL